MLEIFDENRLIHLTKSISFEIHLLECRERRAQQRRRPPAERERPTSSIAWSCCWWVSYREGILNLLRTIVDGQRTWGREIWKVVSGGELKKRERNETIDNGGREREPQFHPDISRGHPASGCLDHRYKLAINLASRQLVSKQRKVWRFSIIHDLL